MYVFIYMFVCACKCIRIDVYDVNLQIYIYMSVYSCEETSMALVESNSIKVAHMKPVRPARAVWPTTGNDKSQPGPGRWGHYHRLDFPLSNTAVDLLRYCAGPKNS